MERHNCKLCHRRFTNRRALGSHMKAHFSTPLSLHSNSDSQRKNSFTNNPKYSISTDEDVAMCLVMMSRDVWTKRKCNNSFRSHTGSEDVFVSVSKKKRVFQCPYCCKAYESGQALGGHKRSHHLKHSYCFIDLNLPAPPF